MDIKMILHVLDQHFFFFFFWVLPVAWIFIFIFVRRIIDKNFNVTLLWVIPAFVPVFNIFYAFFLFLLACAFLIFYPISVMQSIVVVKSKNSKE